MLLFQPEAALSGGGWQLNENRLSVGVRPQIWRMLINAALSQPWTGYGWGQSHGAYLSVADNYPALHVSFEDAHNLLLNFVVWFGVPVGLTISCLVIAWSIGRMRRVNEADDVIPALMIVVVGIHSMLEYPLSHAYFLLPAGVVIGVMEHRTGFGNNLLALHRGLLFAIGVTLATVLGAVVRDYMVVIEPDYRALRFEAAQVGLRAPSEAPQVLVLTQLRALLQLWRLVPRTGMSEQEIAWAASVAQRIPSPGTLFKYCHILALNQRTGEAELWLRKTKKVIPRTQWKFIELAWRDIATREPLLAAVRLPSAD